ncbi:DMP19 family protein [Bradyrhizobium sp. 186]|nr:DMP19 family protein [Bradyrhizobium sp. 186]
MIEGGRLATVVVARDALEAAQKPEKAHYLTEAVVDYVNEIQRVGVYTGRELPAVAMQAYHADYYLAQVNNSGHSQFIGNTGIEMLPTTAGDALAGLKAMGASAQQQILQEMMAWVEAHPGEAALQNGHSQRAATLRGLDRRFYEAEQQQPMTPLAAQWIANWPELRAVAQEQYASEIQRLAQLHPHLSQRRIWRSVRQISFQMTDRLQITVAAACGAVVPEPELKLLVLPGFDMNVEGKQCMAFGVKTDAGSRVCVFEEAGGRLYEYGLPSPIPKPGEVKQESSSNRHLPVVGARLSTVSADTILNFSRIAEQNLAAEAIDLLLRKSDMDPAATITALRVSDDRATWLAVSGRTCVMATTLGDRADLVGSDGKAELTVTRAETERHAAEAAAGRESMRLQA